jgi:O-acetyl-ADP-ribose deacetylase (regulator of RNase III)
VNLKFFEQVGNLFDYQDDNILVHCIAADFGMAGGIAKQFVDKMNMREKLKHWAKENGIETSKNPYGYEYGMTRTSIFGKAILVDGVFNLITKLWTYEKPTYETLRATLLDMKKQIEELGIKKLAMPKIGCGIDGLSWVAVSSMITSVFKDMDIEITIVSLPRALTEEYVK